jgi:hypothetical protein
MLSVTLNVVVEWFVFRRYQIKVSTDRETGYPDAFRGFPRCFKENAGIVPYVSP